MKSVYEDSISCLVKSMYSLFIFFVEELMSFSFLSVMMYLLVRLMSANAQCTCFLSKATLKLFRFLFSILLNPYELVLSCVAFLFLLFTTFVQCFVKKVAELCYTTSDVTLHYVKHWSKLQFLFWCIYHIKQYVNKTS